MANCADAHEFAKKAGVSVTTISRVLNGEKYVQDATLLTQRKNSIRLESLI
ncbi:LacI family DNA-binding transcriptional regulator [Paenibacillus sp. NPDC056579]|uniref:LacI family DNA-binding transcriptional regulator n=1 Tax=Paenibacillus sp. NPDC056579 TaxID=3345871 RepID=UPI0036B44E9A